MRIPGLFAARRSKYAAVKTIVDGIKFDSKAEARRYGELKILQRAAKISQLQLQVPYVLAPAVRFEGEFRQKPALRLVADFRYFDGALGHFVVEDVKGTETDVFRIKRHLMKSVHGIDVRIVK